MSHPPLSLTLIDPAARDLNALQYETSLAVVNGTAYIGYVDAALRYMLAWGPVGGPFDSLNNKVVLAWGAIDDSHNSVSVGVDPAGYIHVAWSNHNATPMNYRVSLLPYDPTSLVNATMGGSAMASVTYPRFYRAGQEFYFLARVGVSGNGDVVMKKWAPNGFVDLGHPIVPLISGTVMSPTDSAYLGQCVGTSDGDLHIVWTHRMSGVPLNCGVFYARFDAPLSAWFSIDGEMLTLPLSRNTPEVAVVGLADTTISNNSLSVLVDDLGCPSIAWTASSGGYRKVMYATKIGDWPATVVVADPKLPPYWTCPFPQPTPPAPSACDLEIQGPTALATKDGPLLLWGRTVAVSRAPQAYARPPSILYASTSQDGGSTWVTEEVVRPVDGMGGELPRDSGGGPYFLLQTLGGVSKPLYLAELVKETTADLYRELPDTELWGPYEFTILAHLRPKATGRDMAVIDKGGPWGEREVRLLIWGADTGSGYGYDQNRIQVLIGESTGGTWGLVWYPEVTVEPLELTTLAVTWDGVVVKVYVAGKEVASTAYAGVVKNGVSRPLIGAARGANGAPMNTFEGHLEVHTYNRALDQASIEALSTG